jgi:predicted transcriptional regulator
MAINSKTTALRIIERLPEDVSLEDIMYELYFRQRIDRGLEDYREGRTVQHSDVKRSLKRWLRSDGR